MQAQENSFGAFRNYENSARQSLVERTYKNMQTNQSLDFVKDKKAKYSQLTHGKMDVFQVFKLLEAIIDESDPDNDLPQVVHAYQTAESIYEYAMKNETELRDDLVIRNLFRDHEWNALPDKWRKLFAEHTLKSLYSNITDWSWFPLVGFVHDLGKVMALTKFGELPQWCVVGDTYPVAAPFSSSNVFYDKGYYKQSPDYALYNKQTDTSFGIYSKHCGFENVDMSWGHDEYIYEVMKKGSTVCPEGLYLLRYHSFYPWHTPQAGTMGYTELASDFDWKMLPLLKAMQKGDLYSKSPNVPSAEVVEKKYQPLLKKYIPDQVINW